MPFLTAAAVGAFVGTVLLEAGKGVLGNTAHASVALGWKRLQDRWQAEKRLANHDLDRAVARAFLMAQRQCCQECLDQVQWRHKFWSDELAWIRERMKQLKIQVDSLEKAKEIVAPVDNLDDLSTLLKPGVPGRESIAALMVEEACRGHATPAPKEYMNYLRLHLFARMCAYLQVEVKHNELAGKALEMEYLTTIAVEHGEALARIEACLLEMGGEFARLLPVMDEKLDRIYDMLMALMDSQVAAAGETTVFDVGPHQQKAYFTGRARLLEEIRAGFGSGARFQVIAGLGGVGKTQAAAEFCHRSREHYRAVLWLQAGEPGEAWESGRTSTSAALLAGFARLAWLLGLVRGEIDPKRAVEAVQQWLVQNDGWLLVVDNAEEPEVLDQMLPGGLRGHVLVTSRRHDWRAEMRVHPLDVWTPAEALEFVTRRTGEAGPAARDLVQALGGLPLALEQAVAFIHYTRGMTVARYLTILAEEGTLPQPHRKLPEYGALVQTTWKISFRAMEKESPVAADLMRLCGFLAPEEIPESVIRTGREFLPEPLAQVTATREWDSAVSLLHNFSLVKQEGDALSVHRLVQQVVRAEMTEEVQAAWVGRAVEVVKTAVTFDKDDPVTWAATARLLPHMLAVAEHGEGRGEALEGVAFLLNEAGVYLWAQAQLAWARAAFERAQAIDEKVYGPDHPNVATDFNNLGSVLKELGDLAGARAAYERALAIDEKAFGPDHPTVATFVNNLGKVLKALGDLAGARAAHERALAIDEKVYGPNHPAVARDVNNLGLVLQALGNLAGARAACERALAIDEKAYGPDHPNVARDLNNLGGVLQDLGDLAGARAAYERALAIALRVFGPDHPTTQIYVRNLASLGEGGPPL